jgi:GTP-binding protein
VIEMKKTPRIVIVGRPNVGKSTLFNRLLGRRQALVHDEPGVTRDRIEKKTKWWVRGKPYEILLTDTGGLGGDRFAEEIKKQVEIALSSADSVIALFDAQAGLTNEDRDLIRQLKKSGVTRRAEILCAINKVDTEKHEHLVSDFFSLGLEKVLTVSAEHGRGIDDLQEAVVDALPADVLGEPEQEISESDAEHTEATEEAAEVEPEKIPHIAIVGRPNVGKSTMTNALLREERMITSPVAGTTVDAVDSLVYLNDQPYILIDTAGIRRKNKTEQGIEVLSVVQARKALERADIAILMLDGESGIVDQDEKIGGLIEEIGCSVILMLNKWDTQKSNPDFTKDVAAKIIRDSMGFLKYAPIMFVSAKERRGFKDLGDLIGEVLHQRQLKIPTHEFTEWVRKEALIHNPMGAKFYLCHQSGRNPPTFVCHVNDPAKIHFSLKRHLINAIRERWGFMGSPVRLLFVKGKSKKA